MRNTATTTNSIQSILSTTAERFSRQFSWTNIDGYVFLGASPLSKEIKSFIREAQLEILEAARGIVREAYVEGLLDGRDRSGGCIRAKDIRAGQNTVSLAQVLSALNFTSNAE